MTLRLWGGYNPDEAHPDPDVEEFAIWLAREAGGWLPRMARWRRIAAAAADASFLRYVGPSPCGATSGDLRCVLAEDHGGDWHDNGAMCWPAERVSSE